jgi:hypothetical protein
VLFPTFEKAAPRVINRFEGYAAEVLRAVRLLERTAFPERGNAITGVAVRQSLIVVFLVA